MDFQVRRDQTSVRWTSKSVAIRLPYDGLPSPSRSDFRPSRRTWKSIVLVEGVLLVGSHQPPDAIEQQFLADLLIVLHQFDGVLNAHGKLLLAGEVTEVVDLTLIILDQRQPLNGKRLATDRKIGGSTPC